MIGGNPFDPVDFRVQKRLLDECFINRDVPFLTTRITVSFFPKTPLK